MEKLSFIQTFLIQFFSLNYLEAVSRRFHSSRLVREVKLWQAGTVLSHLGENLKPGVGYAFLHRETNNHPET